MKRNAFIKKLVGKGCYLRRHGMRHDIYANAVTGRKAPVPRHIEIKDTLCRMIRKQLEIPEGRNKK
ncbi:MAG: type II toxin-antitoxin system HicA family toxin [Elusimicrobiota bacterium]|nr:type II toxin-antitoxin system HicA family toxin [Elusimicrobiota bacterium]